MGESAYGLLLLARQTALALLALLVIVAGVWASWGTARHAMFAKGHERGTLRVSACKGDWCTGTFIPPGGPAEARTGMRIDAAVTDGKGDEVPVAVKSGTDEVIRTGLAGTLHAWVPFGGSLLLAAVLVGGGMRLRRTAWVMGGLGGALLVASFATLL